MNIDSPPFLNYPVTPSERLTPAKLSKLGAGINRMNEGVRPGSQVFQVVPAWPVGSSTQNTFARWANTTLTADAGVTPAAGDVMLLIAPIGPYKAGLYNYDGTNYAFDSAPPAVIVGNEGTTYGGTTWTMAGAETSYTMNQARYA